MSRHDQLTLSTDVASSGELSGDDIQVQINLRLQLEEIADVEAAQLRICDHRSPVDQELRDLAHKIYKDRRLRDRIVGERLFGEPAWDMLLALYCFPSRGEALSVTSLTYAADVPQATGLRWQRTLTGQGMIERGSHGADARRKFVRLTSTGKAMMDRILTRLFHSDGPALPKGTVAPRRHIMYISDGSRRDGR